MVGAEDRARLDQYFTDLRDLERQFDHQLNKPEPIAGRRYKGTPPGHAPKRRSISKRFCLFLVETRS